MKKKKKGLANGFANDLLDSLVNNNNQPQGPA